jgi:2-iminobutanoate/2-iminopropanoate deaminase
MSVWDDIDRKRGAFQALAKARPQALAALERWYAVELTYTMKSAIPSSWRRCWRIASAVLAVALAACGAEQRVYDRDPALPADLPFSSAVVVGDVIFLAGEIGRKPGGTTVVEGGVGAETRQIFDNYTATLARVGASLDDIVKCTVFLDDMSQFSEMNAAYVEFFPGDKPARSTFGVDGLAYGASLEIECVAVKGGGR